MKSMEEKYVLVIDDEVDYCETVKELAEEQGYQVDTYPDLQTVDDLAVHSNMLVFLDLSMPHTDGVEVLRYFRDANVEANIVLMSGQDSAILKSAQLLVKSSQLHLLGVLAKPFSLQEINSLLDNNKHERSKAGEVRSNTLTEAEFIEALNTGQFEAYLQPKMNLKTGLVDSCEALARWQHPTLGTLTPAYFFSWLEHPKYANQFTMHMLEQSCIALKKLNAHDKFRISVNISAHNLVDTGFTDSCVALIHQYHLKPAQFTFELTETTAISQISLSLDTLTRIRLKGFHLSIDDFGTGYASLQQLQELPFDELKIDNQFTMNMLVDESARTILEASVSLASKLGKETVVEGVETRDVLEQVTILGCDYAQGFYLSRPLPAEEFRSMYVHLIAEEEGNVEKLTILLVDDDTDHTETLVDAFESDYQVCTRSSGEEAIKCFEEIMPDIVLLDIGLPDISGYDVCRQLMEVTVDKAYAVIFVSGHSSSDEMLKAYNAGGMTSLPSHLSFLSCLQSYNGYPVT